MRPSLAAHRYLIASIKTAIVPSSVDIAMIPSKISLVISTAVGFSFCFGRLPIVLTSLTILYHNICGLSRGFAKVFSKNSIFFRSS